MAQNESEAAVVVSGISKYFGDAQVLDDISLEIAKGTVHGLVGANGSGKSTLIKILAGVYESDHGQITCDAEEYADITPEIARNLGFRFIHQYPTLFPDLSIADNIAIGAKYENSRLFVKEIDEADAAFATLASIGIHDIDVFAPARSLPAAQQTLIAVARALQNIDNGTNHLRLLVLDEPTAALNHEEAEKIYRTIRKVQDRGISVLYVSHRLPEITELCDTVTVLQDGQVLDTLRGSEINVDLLFRLIARQVSATEETIHDDRIAPSRVERLRVETLSAGPLDNVSFAGFRGEVIGVAGLLGSGRTELLEAISGNMERESGSVSVDGIYVTEQSVPDAVRAGIIFVPEDRRESASFQGLTLEENLVITTRKPMAESFGWLNPKKTFRQATRLAERYDIRPSTPLKGFGLFSGGNQQKAVIARAVQEDPQVLLLDEPTQAVDVGAKIAIHEEIARLAGLGTTVLFVSSDFSELLDSCDRILFISRSGVEISERTYDLTEEEVTRRVS